MFYSLRGTLIHTDLNTAVIECGGIGFKCATTVNTLRQLGNVGDTVRLFTYMSVREDAVELFGFYDNSELDCFKMLISVSGVGPKAAIAILSEMRAEKLALCIATGDSKSLTKVSGIGPKTAQRIVLELKDKIQKTIPTSVDVADIEAAGVASEAGNAAEAVSALVILGYTQSEASLAVGRLDSSLSVEELIKQALKYLSRQV